MAEKHFFFPAEDPKLFGVLHKPSYPKSDEGFVFCHPFAEEKLWSHRVLLNFGRILSDHGYHALRFDFRGHGDSVGSFEDFTIESRLADIQSAIKTLNYEVPDLKTIGLLGLRFGATLAALSTSKINNINKLILWEPILNGQRYMKELFRINIATQSAVYKEVRYNSDALIDFLRQGQTVNIDGYDIKHELYDQMISIDLTKIANPFCGPMLAIQINRKLGIGTKRIQPLEQRFQNIQLAEVEEQPFWKEIKEYYAEANNLFNCTLKWLMNP